MVLALSVTDDATARFDLTRDRNRPAALGHATALLMRHPAFARMSFGGLAALLTGQINRDHYSFVTRDGALRGYLGWALTSPEAGEAWLATGDVTGIGGGTAGDCVVFIAFASDGPEMTAFVVRHMKAHFADKRLLVARRIYADGRIRPLRITDRLFAGRRDKSISS